MTADELHYGDKDRASRGKNQKQRCPLGTAGKMSPLSFRRRQSRARSSRGVRALAGPVETCRSPSRMAARVLRRTANGELRAAGLLRSTSRRARARAFERESQAISEYALWSRHCPRGSRATWKAALGRRGGVRRRGPAAGQRWAARPSRALGRTGRMPRASGRARPLAAPRTSAPVFGRPMGPRRRGVLFLAAHSASCGRPPSRGSAAVTLRAACWQAYAGAR